MNTPLTSRFFFPFLMMLAGLSLAMLPACAPVYVPNAVNTPLLDARGDVQVGGHVGTSGADLQAAAAITDHVGAFADFSIANQTTESSDPATDDDFHRHRFGEVGVGYFTTLGSMGHAEFYGGYGRGWSEAYDEYEFFGTSEVRATGRYQRFFVQPGAGVDLGPLRLNGALRLAHVGFYEFETSGSTVTEGESAAFVEPVVGASLGPDAVRLGLQVGFSWPLEDPDDIAFDYQPIMVSLGLQVRINPLLR